MKKLIYMLLIILLIFLSFLQAGKLGVLSEVLRPESIAITENRLFVIEGANIFIYTLPDIKLIHKFGKEGEGPGELKVVSMLPNNLEILSDGVFIDGLDKVIFFSNKFQLLQEKKKKYMTFKTIPVADRFVAMKLQPQGQNKYNFSVLLLDSEMNPVKELHRQEYRETETDIDMVLDSIHFDIYQDKIYLEVSNQGFLIWVFDSRGNKIREIRRDVEAPAITPDDRRSIMNNFREDRLVKMMAEREGGWDNFKNKMKFNYPEHYPPIKDLMVVDDKIFVSTFERKAECRKHIILDLDGNLLNTVWLPLPEESSYLTQAMGRENRFYGIANGRYYYLIENRDSEEWEIHLTEID